MSSSAYPKVKIRKLWRFILDFEDLCILINKIRLLRDDRRKLPWLNSNISRYTDDNWSHRFTCYLNIRCCCLLIIQSNSLVLLLFASRILVYLGHVLPQHITLKYANEDYPAFTHVNYIVSQLKYTDNEIQHLREMPSIK